MVQQRMYVFGGNHNGRYLGDVQVGCPLDVVFVGSCIYGQEFSQPS